MCIRSRYSLLVGFVAAIAACSRDVELTKPIVLPGATPVLLKDMLVSNLPSPYYHFEYDQRGRAISASFASGLTTYDLVYDGDRLVEMRDDVLVNKDRLIYVYDSAGRVSEVRYVDSSGTTYERVRLNYDGSKLVGLLRQRLIGAGFVPDKEMVFSYDAEGNLSDIEDDRPAIAGLQDESSVIDHFEQYDTGTNVDGFDRIHNDFFDHLVLLPLVQLQKHNPRREIRTGDGLNYAIDYTYAYDDMNRPLAKTGVGTFTNGANAGQQFQIGTMFTYY